MKCEHAQKRLGRYLDGELPPREAQSLERHLQRCGDCAGELDELRTLNGVLDEVQDREAPKYFARRTRQRAESRRAAGVRWLVPFTSSFGGRWRRAAAAAVVLFAGLCAGAYLGWSTVQANSAQPARETPSSTPTVAGETEPVGSELAAAPPGSLTHAYLTVTTERESTE